MKKHLPGIWLSHAARLMVFISLCAGANCLQAAIITTAGSFPQSTADYEDQVISVEGFDPALGTLRSVTIKVVGTGQFTQQFENTSSRAATLRWSRDRLKLVLEWPDRSTPMLSLRQNETHSYRAAAYDGKTDFGGASGGTQTYPVTVSKTKSFTSSTILSQFEGAGEKAFYITASGTQVQRGNSSSHMVALLTAGADLMITYDYAPIPEPGTWLVAGFALVALVLSRRRRLEAGPNPL